MKLEMFQKVRLKSGETGHIVEIFNNGEAYMVELKIEGNEYELVTIHPGDIMSVIVEVDKPFVAVS